MCWAVLLDEVRRRYDLVVLVAPPVLTGPLTPLLVPMADAVVHAVAWDRTQTPVLHRVPCADCGIFVGPRCKRQPG